MLDSSLFEWTLKPRLLKPDEQGEDEYASLKKDISSDLAMLAPKNLQLEITTVFKFLSLFPRIFLNRVS